MEGRVIRAEELHNLLNAAFVPASALNIGDAQYSAPQRQWLNGVFGVAWRKLISQLGFEWASEMSDCDDFARMASAYACLLHYYTKGKEPNTGLAVGEMWYMSPQGGHALNVALTNEGEQYAVKFYEPQNGFAEVGLTPEQVATCWMLRI